MANVGFIGLGNMGKPIVKHLIDAGYTLRVFDVVPAAIEEAKEFGATACDTIAELAQCSDVVITMVQTGEQVQEICFGNSGLFSNLKPGSLLIDSSSIAVKACREVHAKAREQNILMIDAPVSGGVAGAQAGALTIMVGGEDAAFKQAKPYLDCYGKNIIHAGSEGNGQAAKTCNNMILGISMIAVSEAFALGEKLGLDASKLFEISSQASGECWSMTRYCPYPNLVEGVPSNNDYKPGFTASMMLKDLNLSQTAAANNQAQTPLGAEATKLYQEFVDAGFADIDFSAIIKKFRNDS